MSTKDFQEAIDVCALLIIDGLVDMELGYKGRSNEAPFGVTDTYRECTVNHVMLNIGGKEFRGSFTLSNGAEANSFADHLAEAVKAEHGERLVKAYEDEHFLGG